MGIPWGFPRDFSLGMGSWVWGLKSNPHDSAGNSEMEPSLRVTGQRVSDVSWVGSFQGSVYITRYLTRF